MNDKFEKLEEKYQEAVREIDRLRAAATSSASASVLEQHSSAPQAATNCLSASRLPNFSGQLYENASSWIEKMALASTHLSDNDAARQLRFKLDGPAELWLRGLDQGTQESFTELRIAFINKYVDNAQNKWMAMSELRKKTQRPDQSVDNYLSELQLAWSRVRRSPDDQLADFVLGLQTSCQVEVLRAECETLDDAVRVAKKGEEFRQLKQREVQPQVAMMADVLAVMKNGFQSLRNDKKDKTHERKPGTDDDRTGDGRPKCTYCGRVGHTYQACRRRKGACYRCGDTGHLRADCPN